MAFITQLPEADIRGGVAKIVEEISQEYHPISGIFAQPKSSVVDVNVDIRDDQRLHFLSTSTSGSDSGQKKHRHLASAGAFCCSGSVVVLVVGGFCC